MKRCPITYDRIDAEGYSRRGLRIISRHLEKLKPVSFDIEKNACGSSKDDLLCSYARLSVKEQIFEAGTEKDRFMLLRDPAPGSVMIPNMDLTMKLAGRAGVEVVKHGMVRHADDELLLFCLRPVFQGRFRRLPVKPLFDENDPFDLGALLSKVDQTCTFPQLERLKLFRLLLVAFLVGHKAFSPDDFRAVQNNEKWQLLPQQRLINEQFSGSIEKGSVQLGNDLLRFSGAADAIAFAQRQMALNSKAANQVLRELEALFLEWMKLINGSFLPAKQKKDYTAFVQEKRKLFFKY